MPTDVQKFSRGYRGTKGRRPNRIAQHEGRTPLPGVPTGSRNAPTRSAAERRNAAFAASIAVKPPHNPTKAERKVSRAERRRAAAAVAILRETSHNPKLGSKPKTSATPTLTTRNTGNRAGYAPTKAEALAAPALGDLEKLHEEGKIGKTFGQSAYEKLAQAGIIALPEAAELKAGAEGLTAALRGATDVEGTKVGGTKLFSRILKPTEATTAEGRQAVLTRAAEKSAARESSGVKAAVTRAAGKVTRADARADAAVARRVAGKTTRKEAVAAAGTPLKAAKLTAAQVLPVVQGHERAILHNPGKVAKTTARAIPGLVTAPVGQAIGLGITGGRAVSEGAHELGIPGARGYTGKQILAPAENIGKEQLAFARQVAKTLTSDDSSAVQREVEDNLGLLLPIMLGAGAEAIGEKISKGRITEATRRIVEQARSRVGRGHGKHNGQTPRVFETAGQRKREAVRAATARARTHREQQARTRDIRREAGRTKGSEIIRRGVGKRGKLVRRATNLDVHAGDVVNFAVRHSLPLDKPAEALAEVKRIGRTFKPLPKGFEPPADEISSRDLVAAIERNPHWLADKHVRREVEAARAQARYSREHAAELEPEHSEVARHTPAAVTRGIPLEPERFPRSVRDITRAEPTRGRQAKDVLRRESRSDRQRARRQSRKAATREARGRAIAAELKVRERAEPTYTKRNAAVAAKGERLVKQARTYRAGAAKAAEQATRKYHAATEVDATLGPEFTAEVAARLKAEGKPEPEWTSTRRVGGTRNVGGGITAAKVSGFPGRSKRRVGTAEEYGLVQEGLGPYLRESIARPISRRESFKAMRGFIRENAITDDKGRPREFSENDIRRLVNEGKLDRDNYVPIPRQDYKRSFDPEQWTAHLSESLKADPDAALDPGQRYMLVRRPAAKEFSDQLAGEVFSPRLAKINRATSFLILGTSPAWAAAQIVAEYAQAAAAQPKILNPVFVRKAIKAYKDMAPHERHAFDAWVGVTARELTSPGDLKLDLKTGDMQASSDAWNALNRTALGRTIRSIPRGLHDLDQWKGGRIRVLTAAAKIDSDLNRRGGLFLRGIRGMYDLVGQASKELKGRPLSEQLAYVSEHPEFADRYQQYLDDVMGNWSALTKNERLASQAAIFYPFLRMSLRWTFYAFPKRHPIKAAALYYLGQQNASTLRKFLGRDPSYFTEWSNVPLRLGGGKTEMIPLTRIAPGGNAILEALGEGSDPTLIPLKVAQPSIVAAVEGATGVSAMTGEQEGTGWKEKGVAALSSLLTLAAPGRVAEEHLVPKGQTPTEEALPILGPLFGSTEKQESLDKLFSRLEEKGTTKRAARTLGAPVLPESGAYVKDLTRLRAILDALSKNSAENREALESEWADKGGSRKKIDATLTRMEQAHERAENALNAMYKKYGIDAEGEDEASHQRWEEIHYGAKPPAATKIGGVTISPAPKRTSSSKEGVTKIGGVVVGKKSPEPKEGRFYTPKKKQTTIAGVPVG